MTELEQKLLTELESLEQARNAEQEAVQKELRAIKVQLSQIITLLNKESEQGQEQSIEELLEKLSSDLLLGFQTLLEKSLSVSSR